MNVLDLFCGLKGFSQAFKERGHDVVTVDIDKKFNPTKVRDIRRLSWFDFNCQKFDVVLASPPCNCFSVASIGTYWRNGYPDMSARRSIMLVFKTLDLIEAINPSFWILENPRGMLRRVLGEPKATVTMCQYGTDYMKPTDLWGKLPPSFVARSCKTGDDCHEAAPRGSKTGIQKLKTKEERAKIPYQLSLELCKAIEKDKNKKKIEIPLLF